MLDFITAEMYNTVITVIKAKGEPPMKQTTLCYIEKDGKYLMLHRIKKENDENRDKWIGVGGKFENGESPEDCMLREVQEETGLTVTDWKYCGIITFVSDICQCEHMHLFKCTGFSGEIRECDEGVLEWINKGELLKLPMWEGDRIFLELLDSDRPFFSLKLVYCKEELRGAVLDGKKIK